MKHILGFTLKYFSYTFVKYFSHTFVKYFSYTVDIFTRSYVELKTIRQNERSTTKPHAAKDQIRLVPIFLIRKFSKKNPMYSKHIRNACF